MIKEMSITRIDFKNLKPEELFEWFELFGFRRYGVHYYVDPKERDDPRYPAERDESPEGWYTHLNVTSNCYDKTMFIIDDETFQRLRKVFEEKMKEVEK